MAQAFMLPNVVSFTINSRSATGSITSITGISGSGTSATLTGEIFRARVKLPSTWILNKGPIVRAPVVATECPVELPARFKKCFY